MREGPMRSLLFTPGHREQMVARVVGGGLPVPPDVVLLDVEDGVPPAEKESARAGIGRALAATGGGPLRFVRVRRVLSDEGAGDVAAVVRPGLDGIVAPKVARVEELELLDGMLLEAERAAGLADRSVRVIASIETAASLLEAPRIARGPRVAGLMFGSEDMASDLGLPARREAEAAEMLFVRSAIVVAAAAAGIPAFDGIHADFRDPAGLRADSLQGRRLGFSGRQCIHPDQIAIVNEAFSPSAEEIAQAERVVAAFDQGLREGLGAVALDGRMLDAPIVERARRVLRSPRS